MSRIETRVDASFVANLGIFQETITEINESAKMVTVGMRSGHDLHVKRWDTRGKTAQRAVKVQMSVQRTRNRF